MHELVINLHMHTRYSDGHGSHGDIAAAAMQAGLDAVIVTDHNVWVDGPEDYYQNRRPAGCCCWWEKKFTIRPGTAEESPVGDGRRSGTGPTGLRYAAPVGRSA